MSKEAFDKIDEGLTEALDIARGFDPLLILDDALGREREGMCRPFLLFDPINGRVIIADDYVSPNDPTARDFILVREDAVRLAAKLLDYAITGTASSVECVSRADVESLCAIYRSDD